MHRNSQKRIYPPGAAYFITTLTRGRYPYFAEGVLCRMMVDILRVHEERLGFRLHGCAIMPDHVHLLITPGDDHSYSRIMFSLKKQSSHNMNRILGYNLVFYDEPGRIPGNDGQDVPEESAQALARFHGGGPGRHFREFDARLRAYRAEFVDTHSGRLPHPPFRWQKSFHDHFIRDERDFANHLGYVARQCEKHFGGTATVIYTFLSSEGKLTNS